jgi:hypothetical protein
MDVSKIMSYSIISATPGMETGTASAMDTMLGVGPDGISYSMPQQLLAYYKSPFWGAFLQLTA